MLEDKEDKQGALHVHDLQMDVSPFQWPLQAPSWPGSMYQ